MSSNSFTLICVLLSVSLGGAQNCKTTGEWCADTYQCCGGCCLRNKCVNTYDDCTQIDDPCLDEYCPGDSVCQIFKPSCRGCDVQRICSFLNDDSSSTTHSSERNSFHASSQTHFQPTLGILLSCIVLLLLK